MHPLDRIEDERGGEFAFVHQGEEHELPSPLDLRWDVLASVLADERAFAALSDVLMTIPADMVRILRERWAVHHGLPDEANTHRLIYYMRRYPDAIEGDLMRLPGCPPLTELWQSRQWRRLLNAIDSLPRTSQMAAAVAGDEEHARMIAEAQERRSRADDKPYAPPLTQWSPEAEGLADVFDMLQNLLIVTIMANSGKGAQKPAFKPHPRPLLASATIRHQVRQRRHDELARRLLRRREAAEKR